MTTDKHSLFFSAILLPPLPSRYVFLNLARNPVGGDGLMSLCDGLAKCATLKIIDLSACGITEVDLPALEVGAEAVPSWPYASLCMHAAPRPYTHTLTCACLHAAPRPYTHTLT